MKLLYTLVSSGVLAVARASLQIVPGATWTANNGEHIQAHGGGIIKVGSTFYYIGEDKTNGSAFQNINCYSSSNLVDWNYEGALLSRGSSGDLGPGRVVERPKVIFNKSTNQYAMWMHVDSSNYGEAKAGVATSSTVCGKYTYRGSFQPLGHQSRDMGLFQEDDGSAYLLTEDRQNGLRIERLSNDYLSVASLTYTWAEKYEAPAILKRNGVYFMFASKLSGWDPNDNIYSTATSLSGPWSSWKTFADSGSHTYASQTTFILPITSSSALYLGDRWKSENLMRSTYVWLPLTISGTTASMKNANSFIVDASSGLVTNAPSETSYEGESANISGGAYSIACQGCSGSKAVGYIGGSQAGAVQFTVNSSATTNTTIRILYKNGDSSSRHAAVSVNGAAAQNIAFLPSEGGGAGSGSTVQAISVLGASLKAGSNTIKISGPGNSAYGPDIDRIIVPSA